MTAAHHDDERSDAGSGPAARPAAPVPPPGCPAHGGGDVFRLAGELSGDPKELYERLRAEHGAVAPVLVDGDLPAWLVLGYRENLEVVRTPNRFSRDSRRWNSWLVGDVPPDSPLLPMVGWQSSCVFADGAEHERLRAAVNDALAGLDRRGIRRHVTRFTDRLVGGFALDGKADLITQFAEHLPALVMTQLFGMPDEHGPRLAQALLDVTRATDTTVASDQVITDALRQHLRNSRSRPGTDFTTALMNHPAALSEDEVLQHLRLVLIAANETTVTLIGNTLRMLLTDDRFRASLAGVRMTLSDGVEQNLWDEPPLLVCPARWAVGDTELAGRTIRKGDMLLLGLAAGNADPAIRPDPDAPMHGNRSHLAFSGGPHECPGQDIGRAITETAIDVLLSRLPDIHLAVDDAALGRRSTWLNRVLVELPVEFTPRNIVPEVEEPPPPRPPVAAVPAARRAPAAVPAPPAGIGARVRRWLGMGPY